MKARLFSFVFACLNVLLKLKNFNRKRILIYTDSRGYNVISKWGKTPFDSYIAKLCWCYRVDYFICPEKFTTIVDFLEEAKKHDLKKYAHVIMHCGVVDFSPRPLRNIEKVIESKKGNATFDALFAYNKAHHEHPSEVEYYGEKTNTIYSVNYLQEIIGPQIKAIPNLIWIDSNNFVAGWEGNFTKGRPENINESVNRFDDALAPFVANRISLKAWSPQEIQKYTIDNIHFNKVAFNEIFRLIRQRINETV